MRKEPTRPPGIEFVHAGDKRLSTLLHVHRAESGARKALTIGGTGNWAVTDAAGAALLAAQTRLLSNELRMSIDGASLTARMPDWSTMSLKYPEQLEVTDDASENAVFHGGLAMCDVPYGTFHAEEWALEFATGGAITFNFTMVGDRRLGYFDDTGRQLMSLGHDPSFGTKPASTFRILLRFWRGAVTSLDRYRAYVDADALGRLVPAAHMPTLVMLGVWLERTYGQRYHLQMTGDS